MEFIKLNEDKYLIKDSNGRTVSKKEKLKLEKEELIIEDIKSDCGKDATIKIKEVDKEIKEVENGTNSIKKTTKTKK